jgi:predicted RNA polymerase sigma factor
MKYVLMYTNRPDLDAAVPEERRAEVYQAIYAIWLAELVARAMPREPEGWGLLALLTFLSSRTESRFDDQGRLVLLEDQDRARWDGVAMSRADGYLATAAMLGRPGRFQLQAAIAG